MRTSLFSAFRRSSNDSQLNSPAAKKRHRYKWLFRAFAVTFPFLILVFLNYCLYLCDAGHDASFLTKVTAEPDKNQYQFSESVEVAYADVGLLGPHQRPFSIPKSDNTYRIIVFGASSVVGFPYATELAFPSHLEILFAGQLVDRKCEVLNAGIVALSSPALADILRQSLVCQPDLIVVYAGHNDFYGFGSPASNYGSFNPVLVGLRRFRLTQVLGSLGRGQQQGQLIAAMPRDLRIRLNSNTFRQAEQQYRSALETMVSIAADSQVPIVLCCVAGKLRSLSPLKSVFQSITADNERKVLTQKLDQAHELLLKSQLQQALDLIEAAATIDDEFALAYYRRAQCLESMNRTTEAAEDYSRACDLDGCRFRAPSSFEQIVKLVVSQHADDNAYLVDIKGIMASESQVRAPGNKFFMDHVHFTHEGNWRAALATARVIVENVQNVAWNKAAVPTADERDELLAIHPADHIQAFWQIELIPTQPPLNDAPDVMQQADWAKQTGKQILDEISRELLHAYDLQQSRCFQDVTWREFDITCRMSLALAELGHMELALRYAKLAIVRQPWSVCGHILAAGCNLDMGQRTMALKHLEMSDTKVIGLEPKFQELRRVLNAELRPDSVSRD